MANTKVATPPLKFETREAWLIGAIEALAVLWEDFTEDVSIPEIRVSVGFPGSKARVRIGECWPGESTEDGVTAIFISPILSDPIQVLATLTHEIVHAILGKGKGHRKEFIALAKHAGLLPKWTATTPSSALKERLEAILADLGAWPHSALNAQAVAANKQSTRMLLVKCPESDYKVRMTAKWIEDVGTPICPCHDLAMDAQ